MQIVESVGLLPPHICIICETSPQGETVVDTERTLRTGVASILNGRKYVCEECAKQIGLLFGLVSLKEKERADFERDAAKAEVANIRQRVEAIAHSIADSMNAPGITYEGASFEDLFNPPQVDQVREAAASRLSAVESRSEPAESPSKRKARERPPVARPGLAPTEPINDASTVSDATREAAKESDGSSGTESQKASSTDSK
jgi:hypothetical protein